MPKTLKDIKSKHISWDKDGVINEIVKTEDLRDVAIEWIKKWNSVIVDDMYWCEESAIPIQEKVNAFMVFFNITREDLK